MRKNWNISKRTLIALGVLLPIAVARAEDAAHAPGVAIESNSAATYKAAPVPAPTRDKQNNSPYDLFIQKLEESLKTSKDALPLAELSGDDLRVRLSHTQIQSAITSLKHIKKYRDAVEKQCKGIDESAELLVNTIDHCLVKNVLFPAVQKSKLVQDSYEVQVSAKALGACHQELDAYFSEKEKKASLIKGDHFLEDASTKSELFSLFESFGAKESTKDLNTIASSELIKSIKKVDLKNLCDVKLDEKASKDEASKKEDKSQTGEASSSKPAVQLPKSEYKERIEETIEEEEQYIPIAPKKIVEQPPVVQPEPQPLPAAPKPTYQPQPYQPQPVPQKKPTFEPVPPRKNNTPFVPVTPSAPAPRGFVGGGPAPVAPVPLLRGGLGGLGLSLGFGSYSSTVTAPLVPPPMPYYPPMPAPMPLGMGGGGISGISSGPRACLVCSTVTPMPTLGLGTMLAQPCPRINGQQPIGACRPNWNQPMIGYGGITPINNQVPRYPGQPVYPGAGITPQVGGGSVVPNRTTVPRVNTNSVRRSGKRSLRR